MTEKVLLVEDEQALSQAMAAYLLKEGYQVELADDGSQVMPLFKQFEPDIVLLDLMLPHIDGITLCRLIREFSQVPIIMLTARVDEIDRLLGLDIGADDYVCKPYSPREVIARVKAVLRRYAANPNAEKSHRKPDSRLSLDDKLLDAFWDNVPLNLTVLEFRLLNAMASEPRRVFNREQLMQKIYDDYRIVSDRTIDSHITKLRRKLPKTSDGQDVIRSVYGAGYKFSF